MKSPDKPRIMEKPTLEQWEAMRAEIRETLQPYIGKPVTINEKLWKITEIYVDNGNVKVDCVYYDGRNFIDEEQTLCEFDLDTLYANVKESIPKVIALNEAEKAESLQGI